MTTNSHGSESSILEKYRITFENAQLQSQIAGTLAEFGYTAEKMATGKAFYDETRLTYDSNKTETDESLAAYVEFNTIRKNLDKIYSAHRKKAKVAYRKNEVTAAKLGITGSKPQAYIKWLEAVKKFYSLTTTDTTIQNQLSIFKISVEDLDAANALITEVEALRAAYLKEKGESQDATTIKDAAFAKLDDWMSEFYAVAKIAMEDNPQLLEALGLIVRS